MDKILLIEDDQTMRENTAEMLELSNFKVETAENGKLGVQKAKEFLPDLIISDIMMPELDGYGVLHMLSKDPATSTLPFIYLTAKVEKSEIRKGMDLGADDYLVKPFTEMELLGAIETRLAKARRMAEKFTAGADHFPLLPDSIVGLEELTSLLKEKKSLTIKKKQVLFNEGDFAAYLYLLEKGRVKVYRTHDDGKEYITSIFGSGEYMGLAPIFENKTYSDSALTIEDCQIKKIPRDEFVSLLHRNRDVAEEFIKTLSQQVDAREKQLLSFAYDTVRKRTAEALISLYEQSRGGSQNDEISITREDLASIAGTATETVIRCLSSFKEESFIEVRGRKIAIIDIEGLREVN